MKNTLEILATTSRFAIAVAIIYFAWQLTEISRGVPEVLQSVDQVSRNIEPALDEAGEIRREIAAVRELVPQILDEVAAVRLQIPLVVGEVENVRATIPPILERVDAIEKQIPPLLQRIDNTVSAVDRTQRQIPAIVATADKAVVAINDTRNEVVPLLPQALEEIRLTRDKIDPTLDRVELLIDDVFVRADDTIASVEAAGQEASEGAVKGFFTGIIKLPFQLVGTLATPITKNIAPDVARQITETDIEMMVSAGNRALKSGRVDRERRWENPDSGNSGSITILRFFELQGAECVEARVQINNSRREIQDKLNEFCRDDDGKWTLASEIE